MMRPLFFLGNRRSGTTLFTALLNTHPHVFVSHEADTLRYVATGGDMTAHPDDHPENLGTDDPGLSVRAGTRRDQFLPWDRMWGGVRERFFQDLMYMMTLPAGQSRDAYPDKKPAEIKWAGDKKPEQASAPEFRDLIKEELWDGRAFHLVRRPEHCIASMAGLGWAGGNYQFLTDYWCRLEQQAEDFPMPTYTLKYEDLCEFPHLEMLDVFEFLGVDTELADGVKMKQGRTVESGQAFTVRHGDPDMVPVNEYMREWKDKYGYS